MILMRIEVIGIDHIYISVSQLARSEKYYDQIMPLLGFKKNTFLNEGDLHIQYYNRHFGYVLRPANTGLAKQNDSSGAAPVTNESKDANSTRKPASHKETGQTKTQPEDVKLSAGISEIVKMVKSDTDSAVIQTYVENSPVAYYPSA